MTQPLSDPAHDSLVELLPWFVNGTLDEAEHRAVEAHLGVCAECRDDAQMLSLLRRSVRNNSPAPLVPPLRAEALLSAFDSGHGRSSSTGPWIRYAAAATVVVAIAAAWFLLQQEPTTGGTPAIFQTATSDDSGEAIGYVVEVRFEPGASADERVDGLAAIGAGNTAVLQDDGSYRVTLGPGPATLGELEARIEAIEALPDIASARVVAVQLPVE